MFGDRRATFRSYERIETIAEQARLLGRLSEHSRFNIVDYLTGSLRLSLKVNLDFQFFKKAEHPVPAFVECKDSKNIVLNVEWNVWRNAEAGFREPRYIVAHEIGHILMHAHDKLAYSASIPSVLAALPPEDRTEPQANLFADLFLVPSRMLEGFAKAEDIGDYFDVPIDCAKRRLENIIDYKRRRLSRIYVGETCPECANFTLVRNGTCLECETCGNTTGCS